MKKTENFSSLFKELHLGLITVVSETGQTEAVLKTEPEAVTEPSAYSDKISNVMKELFKDSGLTDEDLFVGGVVALVIFVLLVLLIVCGCTCLGRRSRKKRKKKKKNRDEDEEKDLNLKSNEQYYNQMMKGRDIKSISQYASQKKPDEDNKFSYEDAGNDYCNQVNKGKNIKSISEYKKDDE